MVRMDMNGIKGRVAGSDVDMIDINPSITHTRPFYFGGVLQG